MTSKNLRASLDGKAEGWRFTKEMQVSAIYSQNPEIRLDQVASPCFMREDNVHFNFDSPAISVINTPAADFEGSRAVEMSNLPPPKVRSRLTSTPNLPGSGMCRTSQVDSLLNDGFRNLSPTGVSFLSSASKAKSCLHKRPMVDDPKGVLFPLLSSDTGQAISDDNMLRGKKIDRNREIEVDLSHFHLSSNQGPSFQDSGFESLGNSIYSQEPTSFINSPIKRKAGGDIISVESPLKRLAFGMSQIQAADASDFAKRIDNYDTSLPGSSFFCDKNERMNVPESPPTPIFANAIQFSPSRNSKPTSTNSSFIFTKPTVLPPKRGMVSLNATTQRIPASEKNCHAGKTHFDIISHLAKWDLSHVITKIFGSMRSKDIFRSSHVSASWAAICQNNMFLQSKIRALKKQYHDDELKYGSENVKAKDAIKDALLKSPAKENSGRDLSTGRSTLGNLQRRAKRTPTKPATIMPTTPSGKNHYVPAENKFQHNQAVKRTLMFGETLRPCPKCGWTAKIYGDGSNKGLCYRYKCRFVFCTTCKSSYHFPKQCSPPKLSPPSKSEPVKEPKIGTKKSRERLKKRLLM